MKILILFLSLLLITSTSYAQVSNTDSFVKEIFSSVKENDTERFVNLFPNAEAFKTILQNMMEKEAGMDSLSKALSEQMLNNITDSLLYPQYVAEFNRIMDSAKVAGIDWPQATYAFHYVDTSVSPAAGGKSLHGTIVFTQGEKEYFFRFEDALWPADGKGWWGLTFRGLGEMKPPAEE